MQQEILKEQRTDLLRIDPRLITADETFNVRADYGELDELMNSIIQNGVKQPLRGFRNDEGMFTLTDGFRRQKAILRGVAKELIDIDRDEFRVPFILEKRGYRQEDRVFDMFITQDNKKLTDSEIAELFYRLHHNFEISIKDIATKTGKSQSYVRQLLTLGEAPHEVREAVKEKKIKTSAAIRAISGKKKSAEEKTSNVKNAIKKATDSGKKSAGINDVKNVKGAIPEGDTPLSPLKRLKEALAIVDGYDKSNPNEIDVCKKFGLQWCILFLQKPEMPLADTIEYFKTAKLPS